MYRGKMHTVIFGTKPTQKEALKAMSAELEKAQERRSSRTFMESAEEYIESKRIVLSPSTVAGYRNITSSLHHPSTKDDSQHTIDHLPMHIAEKIHEQGHAYKGNPCSITQFLASTQDSLGIPRFSVHKLRHYFASKMSTMNVPKADILL